MSSFYYLDLSLEFEEKRKEEITAVFFKKNIVQAVKILFGDVATAIDIDILKYNPQSYRAIVRVPTSHYVKVRTSLTLCGFYELEKCAYRIHKATPLLLSLLGDSRDYKH